MTQWFLSYDGQQLGPMDISAAQQKAKANKNGYAWKEGFSSWMPINTLVELTQENSFAAGMPRPSAPPTINNRTNSDQIDFKIFGTDSQFVEIELDPGESAVAEAGAMFYKDNTINMESVFGDGSAQKQSGFMDKLVGAGKRLITGESLFITVFTHSGNDKARVAFAAPYPGTIIPVSLKDVGGTIICQKDSFLCAAKGVSIGIYFQKKILAGLFGGEGFIMQKLEGDGLSFFHAGGTIVERELTSGQEIHVDTGCIVAFQPSVQFDLQQAGSIKSMIFGGEGFFFATLKGPGKVWLQSMPISRLAGRINSMARAPMGKEEGSALGVLGTILQGDRNF